MQDRFIQSLEHRSLLSAAPWILSAAASAGPIAGPAVHDSHVTTRSALVASVTTPVTPTVRATDLTGDWSGFVKVKIFIFKKKFDAALHITGQSDTTLTGKITIKGHDYSGTFTGKINPATGRFRWQLHENGANIKLVGRLNTAGTVAVGNVEAKYAGFKVKGSFRFEQPA